MNNTMTTSKWYSLTPDELRSVVNSPKNEGLKGGLITFIIVMANVLPMFLKFPIKFIKTYFSVVFTKFIKE